jgi:hypothetical protein
MELGIFIFLVMLLSALPLFVIAYLIRGRKQVGLIAGLDPNRVADREGLGRWVGLMLFLLGAVTILMGLGIWLYIGKTLIIVLAGVALLSALTIAPSSSASRDTSPEGA